MERPGLSRVVYQDGVLVNGTKKVAEMRTFLVHSWARGSAYRDELPRTLKRPRVRYGISGIARVF